MKGAPCGIVKVGVSKPVSPNSIFSTVSLLEDYTCTVNKSFSTPQAQESGKIRYFDFIDNKLMYIPIDDIQNYSFFRLKL